MTAVIGLGVPGMGILGSRSVTCVRVLGRHGVTGVRVLGRHGVTGMRVWRGQRPVLMSPVSRIGIFRLSRVVLMNRMIMLFLVRKFRLVCHLGLLVENFSNIHCSTDILTKIVIV
jgi:hypothetical protein